MDSSSSATVFWLQHLGLVLEIIGVACMANGYLKLAHGWWPKLKLLVSALVNGDTARGALEAHRTGFFQESYVTVVRGLALIGAGFVCQLIALYLSL